MTISNNADAFKIHYGMMNGSGIWPKEAPGIFYNIRTALSWVLPAGLCLTMLMEVINDLDNFTKLSEILYIMVTIAVYLVKASCFTYHRKTFVNMINTLKDPVFVSYPVHLDHYMAKTIKISTFIANVYRYLCVCCLIMYTLYPILDNKPLPFPFPYELGKYRYVMYIFQMFGASNSAWNDSTLDTLTTSLMGIGAAQLDILREKIILSLDEDSEAEQHKSAKEERVVGKLKQCIEHHLAIIKFIETIEHIFSVGLLAQFFASAMVICNTLFHFVLISRTSTQFFMLANYFALIATQLTIYCWYGNEIMWKSELIGEACYFTKWYNCNSKVGKFLFIIMERSKRPLAVTAWKLSNLSLRSLTSILQWSYSYLNLLLKMYKQPSGK